MALQIFSQFFMSKKFLARKRGKHLKQQPQKAFLDAKFRYLIRTKLDLTTASIVIYLKSLKVWRHSNTWWTLEKPQRVIKKTVSGRFSFIWKSLHFNLNSTDILIHFKFYIGPHPGSKRCPARTTIWFTIHYPS